MNEPIKRYRSHITDTMKLTIPKTRTELKQHLNDPLFKNSYFLMATTVIGSLLGFIFWMLVASFILKSALILG